jgi:hypothetical protein
VKIPVFLLKLLMVQLSHCEPSFFLVWCSSALISDAFRAFLDPTAIITCTLLGVISRHNLSTEGVAEAWRIESIPVAQTQFIAKANTLAVRSDSVAVGGFRADGKGLVEVYRYK